MKHSLELAKTRNTEYLAEIKKQIEKLMANVEAELNVENPNWGHVGSMMHIADELTQINETFEG
jgi:hypothetical protein